MFGAFLAFAAVFISLLFNLFVTVHRKTNVLANLYWDDKYSDSECCQDTDETLSVKVAMTSALVLCYQ